MVTLKRLVKRIIIRIKNGSTESNLYYKKLYDEVHDLDMSRKIEGVSTSEAFKKQWEELPTGEYLLSDPWFKDNVDRILTEQELLIKPEWFRGKKVLDAGCGNGRWSYGFSKLSTDLTCVDINANALRETKKAIFQFANPKTFLNSPLEELNYHIKPESFDLVFCWGVAHHCESFNKALDNLTLVTKPNGIIYLYLYGRESLSMEEDLYLFKQRLIYNTQLNDEQKMNFLLKKAKGNRKILHNVHDIYAPLINRRFYYNDICDMLKERGFCNFLRTINHTEVFVRATKGDVDLSEITLPPKKSPYWFEGKHI